MAFLANPHRESSSMFQRRSVDGVGRKNMSHRMLSNWITGMLTMMFICTAFRAAAAQPENPEDIRKNMAYLKPLIGNWDASADFHLTDGGTAHRRGSYKISSILDDTYLQWDVTLWSDSDPSRRHSFLIFI